MGRGFEGEEDRSDHSPLGGQAMGAGVARAWRGRGAGVARAGLQDAVLSGPLPELILEHPGSKTLRLGQKLQFCTSGFWGHFGAVRCARCGAGRMPPKCPVAVSGCSDHRRSTPPKPSSSHEKICIERRKARSLHIGIESIPMFYRTYDERTHRNFSRICMDFDGF